MCPFTRRHLTIQTPSFGLSAMHPSFHLFTIHDPGKENIIFLYFYLSDKQKDK